MKLYCTIPRWRCPVRWSAFLFLSAHGSRMDVRSVGTADLVSERWNSNSTCFSLLWIVVIDLLFNKFTAIHNKAFIDIRLCPGIATPLVVVPAGCSLHFSASRPLLPNMTSSIKREAHSVAHRRQKRTEPWPQGISTQNFVTIGPAVPGICSRTDRRTDRQTHRRVDHNTPHPYRGEVKSNKWSLSVIIHLLTVIVGCFKYSCRINALINALRVKEFIAIKKINLVLRRVHKYKTTVIQARWRRCPSFAMTYGIRKQ